MYFSLPGMNEFRCLNGWFVDLYNSNGDFFYDDVILDNVYGSVPNVIWNGGRNHPVSNWKREQIINLFEYYKNKRIKLRFTFTNMLLKNEHLYDEYANSVLDLINEYGYEITIYSEVLEEYIRNKYPEIEMISSTTKCILDIGRFNREVDREYKLVVLDFRKNADFEFLDRISNTYKVELLLNEDCYSTCEQRVRHYRDISDNILHFDKLPDTEVYCRGKYRNLYESFGQKTTITVDDLYGKYKDMGFVHAKLRGRRSDYYDVLESYVYYLIKPRYRDMIRLEALQARLFNEE